MEENSNQAPQQKTEKEADLLWAKCKVFAFLALPFFVLSFATGFGLAFFGPAGFLSGNLLRDPLFFLLMNFFGFLFLSISIFFLWEYARKINSSKIRGGVVLMGGLLISVFSISLMLIPSLKFHSKDGPALFVVLFIILAIGAYLIKRGLTLVFKKDANEVFSEDAQNKLN